MKKNLALIAAATFFALSLGVAQAADTSKPGDPHTGAAIGTPGQENKGTAIPVPDKESRESHQGGHPAETTPNEENKGKPAVKD